MQEGPSGDTFLRQRRHLDEDLGAFESISDIDETNELIGQLSA